MMDCGTTDIGKGERRDYTKYHCPHGKQKAFCFPCGGNCICEHQRNKYTCQKRKGSSLCEHGKKKYECREGCGGGRFCKHGKQKRECREGCGGGNFCKHGKQKQYCKDCGGSGLCKTPHCPMHKNPKYDGCFWYCFANLFLDKPVVRNYRTKETTVATFL
eukprot:333865_1